MIRLFVLFALFGIAEIVAYDASLGRKRQSEDDATKADLVVQGRLVAVTRIIDSTMEENRAGLTTFSYVGTLSLDYEIDGKRSIQVYLGSYTQQRQSETDVVTLTMSHGADDALHLSYGSVYKMYLTKTPGPYRARSGRYSVWLKTNNKGFVPIANMRSAQNLRASQGSG